MRLIGWLTLLVAIDASAYVRSTSPKSGKAFVWTEACLVVQPDGRGSQDLDNATIAATLARAADNWNSRTDSCTNLRLSTAPAQGPLDVQADGQPALVFRDISWARPGGMMHDPAAIGLTTVFHVSTPGQPGDATILDADIELNGVYFTFTTDPTTATPRIGADGLPTKIADLENTLTHELGHVQGLAHTCWDHITDTPPVDDQGNPIPDCDGPVPQQILTTTMYPYSLMDGETSKRHLSQDDVNGICDVYPSSDPPKACSQKVLGGCSMSPLGARATTVSALLPIGVPLAIDEAQAAARLAEIRARFSTRDKGASMADLQLLAREAEGTESGGRTQVWLGDLLHQAGTNERAREFYLAAAGNASAEVRRLGERGLGDVALGDGRLSEASAHYAAALPGAPAVLAAELSQKIRLAARLQHRREISWAACALIAAALFWFGWRIRRGSGGLGLPTELWYVLPIYALLILGCVGRDAPVLHALIGGAIGSALLIGVSGLAARRSPGRTILHASVVALANLALFYVVVQRSGLIDTLMITVGVSGQG
jgi:hypothetical protein